MGCGENRARHGPDVRSCGLVRSDPQNGHQPMVSDRSRFDLPPHNDQRPVIWRSRSISPPPTLNCPMKLGRCARLMAAAPLAIALGFMVFLQISCSQQDPLPPLVASLRQKTMPTDYRPLASSSLQRSASGATAAWEFETGMTWSEYLAWVEGRFRGDFTSSRPDDTSAIFTKELPGDSVTLQVQLAGAGPPTRVRVDFIARPN